MDGMLNIGLRSLMAYQTALNVTSQNIANVNTKFYSREEVDFVEAVAGNGVSVGDVMRIYDDSVTQGLRKSTSAFATMDTYLTQLKNFEPLLDDDVSSIATYINASLSALQQVNTDPSSVQARNLFLSKLTNLASQFNNINSEINSQQLDCNQYLQNYVLEANQCLQNIASMNQQLSVTPTGQDVSQLLVTREQQLQQLAHYFNFTTQTDSQGIVNLYLSNGMQLINGNQAISLTTVTDSQYPTNLDVAFVDGNTNIPLNAFIQDGNMAGILDFRQTLQQAQIRLGRLALTMSDQLNTQNKLGLDYNGNIGGNIFNDVNSTTAINNRCLSSINNTGNGQMTVVINNSTLLSTSDYELSFTTGNNYQLTRMSDGTVMNSGTLGSLPQAISVSDGFTININAGTINAGDQFVISPTNDGAQNMALAISDSRLFAFAMPVVAFANASNRGDGVAQLTSVTDTTNSSFSTPGQLSPPVSIQFLSATSYQIVNASSLAVIEGPITYNLSTGGNVFPTPGSYDPGYRITLSGNMQAGDSFNINYNNNSIGDNANGINMSNLYQAGLLNGGTLNFTQAYRDLSGEVSRQTNTAQMLYDSTKAVHTQALNSFNEVSAVDLQEETVNLTSYQEAYQASAQVLQVAKSIFDTILGMLRS